MGWKLRVPATSANLGPGFDALGLAMGLFLEIEAEVAEEFSIVASGRDAALVGSLDRNLMMDTYRELLQNGPALRLKVNNEIPLGMGCGSSAAALVAGVMLANHFGGLGFSREQVLEEAARREGHPDNVAACVLGGMTASAMAEGKVTAVSLGAALPWRLLLAIPRASLATSEARALLPETYSRADYGGECSVYGAAGRGVCAGTKGLTGRGDAGPAASDLPGGGVSAAWKAGAAGWVGWDSIGDPERCGAVCADDPG